MKRTHLPFIVIMLLLLSVGESKGSQLPTGRAVLCGEIRGAEDSTLVLYINRVPLGEMEQEFYTHETVLKNGKFYFEFELDGLALINFSRETLAFEFNFAGEWSVYLEPGDSVYMVIPGLVNPRASDIEYYGRGIEKQLLVKKLREPYKQYTADQKLASGLDESLSVSVSTYATIDSVFQANKGSVSREFWRILRMSRYENYIYNFASQFLRSPAGGDDQKRIIYNKYRNQIFGDVADIIRDIAQYGSIGVLHKLALADYLARHELPFNLISSGRDIEKIYPILCEIYEGDSALEAMLARSIAYSARLEGYTQKTEKARATFLKAYPDSRYREMLNSVRDNLTYKRQALFSYDFVLFDTLNRPVALSGFKGKVLLMDFFFNGCGGCYHVAPQIEELEAEFRGEDVVFISVSVDKSLNTFKKGIGKFCSKTAIPLYTGGRGSDHPLRRHFDVIGYPTIVLIDGSGNVLSRRTGLRKSEDEKDIRHLIYEALLRL